MIASMTGFASATEETPQGSLAVELKTVNHRYIEFQTRIPEEFRPLEPAMREAVAAKLTRGKVDCRVTFTAAPSSKRSLVPDADAMAALHAASKEVLARFPEARPLSVGEVLHLPGVLADASLSAVCLPYLVTSVSWSSTTRANSPACLRATISSSCARHWSCWATRSRQSAS